MDSTSIIYKVHPRDLAGFKLRFNINKYVGYSEEVDCFRIVKGVYQGYSSETYYKARGCRVINYVDFNLYIDESRATI